MKKFMPLFLLVTSFFLAASGARAQSYLVTEGQSLMDETAREKRVGIEIEFKNVSDAEIRDLVLKHYPGAAVSGDIAGGLEFKTDIGTIRVVIEGSAYKYENDPVRYEEQKRRDLIEAPREIVFPPVTFDEIPKMHRLFQDLKAKGALGTTADNAVSIQVNLEMRQLTNRQNVRYVLDLLRNYYSPEHRKHVEAMFTVPEKRREYILDPSPGMMRKLNDANYRPTPREFYDDFMYRQSLEFLGDKHAWSRPIEDAKRTLLSRQGEAAVVPQVMKMNKVRVSSLLLMAFPEDELTKRVIESRWARPMPVAEFREFNNDFDLLSKVRWAVGAARASELYGAYRHDELFSKLTGMGAGDIKRLRDGLRAGKKIIRYVLQSPDEPLGAADRAWLRRNNPGVIQIQLSPDRVGALPMVLQDGAQVWHRRNIHRATLLGERNPGLENALIQQALENKLVEALTFNRYAPGSFPETIPLKDVPSAMAADAEGLVRALNARFPEGWVLKGAWDLSSEKIIVTDKIDFKKALDAYRGGFKEYREQVTARLQGADPEAVIYELKKHPGYMGYKIMSLLEDRNLLLVQQRRQLVEEFRVEVQGGKVLSRGSTVARYAYLKKNKKANPWEPVLINQAEAFAQKVIDRLPPELRAMPYGFDVALTKQGDWVLIETNPGGNSSFLEENPRSSRALLEYLRNYRPPTEGLLSQKEQMDWIRGNLARYGLDARQMYPGIELTADAFVDSSFKPVLEDKRIERQARELLRGNLPGAPAALPPADAAAPLCRDIFL